MFKTQKAYFSIFLLWFPIVSISIYIGVLLSQPLGELLYANNGMSYSASNDGVLESTLSLLLLLGLFMGAGQWFVLNTKIKKAYFWIPATIIGLIFGSFISFIIIILVGDVLLNLGRHHYEVDVWIQGVTLLMTTGMIAGVFQWISLKRKLATSLKWSLVTGLSFTFSIIFSFIVDPYPTGNKFVSPTFSIFLGLITGIFVEPLIFRSEIENTIQKDHIT